MEMEIEVVVTVGEVSLHPDIVDGIALPQLEPEVHTDSNDDLGDDPNDDFFPDAGNLLDDMACEDVDPKTMLLPLFHTFSCSFCLRPSNSSLL